MVSPNLKINSGGRLTPMLIRYSDFDTMSLSGGNERHGIDVTVEIDLQFEPNTYRNEVVEMIEAVS